MKLMIASDIHGSARYAGQLIDAFAREAPDTLLLLGDLLYHGPRNPLPDGYEPMKVFELLNGIKRSILAVRGNCDSEVDQMVLEMPIMADYALLQLDGQAIYATHGHLSSPENPPPMQPGTVFFSGHTHVPVCERRDGFIFANPGSVSLPKQGSARGYMLLCDGQILHKSLDGGMISAFRI